MGKWELPPKGGHMETPGVYLQTMNMTQINERLKTNDLIIIPIGSTECHGAAQPIGEDTFLVTRMAEQVAQKMGCTIAMPVWYGSHPFNHLGMPGTVVVPEDAFLANLRAIIAGLWNMGFRKADFSERPWPGRSHSTRTSPVGEEVPSADLFWFRCTGRQSFMII